MNNNYYFIIIAFFLLSLASCNKKNDDKTAGIEKEFLWHDNLQLTDIPDITVKGFLDGTEVKFAYINFERWRGSNDNVINFSLVVPVQKCGSVDGFTGFSLINKGNPINNGHWLKSKFEDDSKSYQAFIYSGGKKSSSSWNCALSVENISDKTVTGKIALFFNDEKRSWIAGKFEALICNN